MKHLAHSLHLDWTSWRLVKGGSPVAHALGVDRDMLGFVDLVDLTLHLILWQDRLRAEQEKDVNYEGGVDLWKATAGSDHRQQLEFISHHWGYYRGRLHEMWTEGFRRVIHENAWSRPSWKRPDWKAYAIVWCEPQLRNILSMVTSPEAHSTMRAAVHHYLDPAAVSRLDECRPPVHRFDRPFMKPTQSEDDICPICRGELEPDSGDFVWCKTQCGATYHALCFEQQRSCSCRKLERGD
ncbi:uncharacterized protein BO66DRAFT_403030 [Aspergillus aculeatinus CBS 121060]|uniref:Uncharacterized protein n=1 Tax=Aspergillus aculeatinus CBS 121060 TaxID=1448322 RepID=A0ACD1H3Z2_9EURO|nr:hypothetical protein BO66DRAFT_403030 [Aspergillus aculeatinus CBS 121060]RAH68288.1 hypothetical protein BO66DRAFT_403030 [Aspergillus aculeatinus CBS 121060]